jgi:septum site-determining protein MinC
MAASGAHKGAAFELKGRMATLSVMRVLHADVDTLLTQLDARLAQAPGFFDGMPLVIAPAESVSLEPAALIALVDGLKARGLTPVAAAECTPEQAACCAILNPAQVSPQRNDLAAIQPPPLTHG